jgi:hypothetical protein
MNNFNLASLIQKYYSRNDIKDLKVALIYYHMDSPKNNLKYGGDESLYESSASPYKENDYISNSSYPHRIEYVFESLSNSQNPVDCIRDDHIGFLYLYEFNDVIYISANHGTLLWMFRGDLDNFPKIQFILSPPDNDFPIDVSSVLSFVDKSVRSIMETLSCVNQILLSDHLSIALFDNDALIEAASSSLADPQLVNGYYDTISFWFKKSALINQLKSKNQSYQQFLSNLATKARFATLRSTMIEPLVLKLKLNILKADNNSIPRKMIQIIDGIESIRGKLNLTTLVQNAERSKVVFIVGTEELENDIVFRSIAGNKYVDESTVPNCGQIYHDESTNIVYVNTPSYIDIDYLFQNMSFTEFQFMIVSSYTTINTKVFFDYLEEVMMTIDNRCPIEDLIVRNTDFDSMPHICLVVTSKKHIEYSNVFPYEKYFTNPDSGNPLNDYCANIITKKLYVVVILDSQEDPVDESNSNIKELVTKTAFYSLNDYVVTIFKDYTADQVTEILRYLIVDAIPRDNIDKVVFVVGPGSKARTLHYLADDDIENKIADKKLFLQTACVRNISQRTVFVNVPANCDLSRFFLEELPLSVQILVALETDDFDTGLFRPETILQNLNVLSRLQLSKNTSMVTSMVRFKGYQLGPSVTSYYKFFQLINDPNNQQERSQFMSAVLKPENFVKLNRTTKRQDNWIRYQLEIKKISIDDIVQKYQYPAHEDGIPYLSKVITIDDKLTS